MNPPVSIPPATLDKLAQPAAPGFRHRQILEIALSLVSAGIDSETVFAVLRPNYGPDLPDSEIRSVIDWAETTVGHRRIFDRSAVSGIGFRRSKGRFPRISTETVSDRSTDPVSAVTGFLNGFECEAVDLWERSPVRLPERFETDASFLLSTLFEPGDFVNVVSEYARNGEKGHPTGTGTTRNREQWLAEIDRNGPPNGAAGVWIRLNPTDATGISDGNVTDFRFLLVEFDRIPLSIQLPFLARLRLPIAAIIASGGKSLHAWVRIGARTGDDYRARTDRILKALARFGVDTANRNPSRLSRLPGVFRTIGGIDDNRQRLLYLNPFPEYRRIID